MIHDWGLTYNMEYPRSAKKLRVNEKKSFAVKLCPKCDRTYEMTHNQYKQISTTHYYKNFPRRGLYNQTCITCEKSINE